MLTVSTVVSSQFLIRSKTILLRKLTQLFLPFPPLLVVLVVELGVELLVVHMLVTLRVVLGYAIHFIKQGGLVLMEPTFVSVDYRPSSTLRGISSQSLFSTALFCCLTQ